MHQHDFGGLLRRFRLAAGLSQEALAEHAGLSRNAISVLERGERTQPYPHTLEALAGALGLNQADRAQLMAAARPSAPARIDVPSVPAPLTPIVGRDAEIATIQRMLSDTRLLTLTGAGGVGKSRLALEVARRFEPSFADGVVVVPLAPLTDAALVGAAMAARLGMRDGGANVVEALQSHLRHHHLLLVLDNFEHVLPAAVLVAELLGACPTLRIMTTSRAPLRIRGEWEFPVPPLSVPSEAHPLTVSEIEALPAVQIFLRQARAVSPVFTIQNENADAIKDICRRLDGIPLALELAAAWVRLLTPRDLLARLDRALPILVDGGRDLPQRHQTMRDTVAWSYQLLDPHEQHIFCRLSVFTGGWTLAAVEALVEQSKALPLLGRLVEHSLVTVEARREVRYTMLEPIRQYGVEQLEAHDAATIAQDDHAAYILHVAEAVEPELQGLDHARAVDCLDEEQDNIRAALHWWLSRDEVERAARLAGAVWPVWDVRGQLGEGRRWLGQIYVHSAELPTSVRTKLLFGLGTLAHAQGDYALAVAFLEESLGLARQANHGEQIILLLSDLGVIAHKCGDYARAVGLQTEALSLARALKHTFSIGGLLNNLGWAALWHGDSEHAVQLLEEALEHARQQHDPQGMMATLNSLAIALTRRQAYGRAEALFHESLTLARDIGHQRNIAYNLGGLAELALACGNPARAVRLWGADAALRERMAYVRPPVERAMHEHSVAEARSTMPALGFQKAWATGWEMMLEEAVTYALTPQND